MEDFELIAFLDNFAVLLTLTNNVGGFCSIRFTIQRTSFITSTRPDKTMLRGDNAVHGTLTHLHALG